MLLTLFQWGLDAWAWSSSIIEFCKFSWGRQQEHPSPCYVHSSHGWWKHWESCSESRGFPTALCRRFTAGIWLSLFSFPSGRNSPLGQRWEGAGTALTLGCRQVCAMWEQCLSLIPQQKNISLLVLLALLDLVFGSWWPLCRALGESCRHGQLIF